MSKKGRGSSTAEVIAKAVAQSGFLVLWAALSLRGNQNESSSENKKYHHTFLSIVFSSFVILIMLASMVLAIATISTVDEPNKSIFGYRIYLVKTDSMSPSENNADMDIHFSAGDIIFARIQKDNTALQVGDVVTFISTNSETFGETVTHMIREVKKDGAGNVISYVTYGTNTGESDDGEVTPDRVLGKYVAKIPKAGSFFSWMKSPHGYLLCVLLPLMFLLFYYGIHSIRLSRTEERY